MKRAGLVFAILMILAVPLFAQAPPGPPKPGPEHKRLSYFVGKWTFEGDEKPNPFSPGGKFAGSESSEWFPGGFFLVSRQQGKGPTGPIQGQSTMGYNSEKKTYTFHMVDNHGFEISARGTVSGDTWTQRGDDGWQISESPVHH